MGDTTIAYKICSAADWEAALRDGVLPWSDDDRRDGYMHLSTGEHVRETARLHYRERTGLWLLAIDLTALGDALRWDAARGGALFPHLYGELSVTAVLHSAALPRLADDTLAWPAWCP